MNEFTWYVASLMAGAGASCGYFSGLWWTTNRMVSSRRPLVVYSLSLIARMGLLLFGMWLLIQISVTHSAFAIAGFLIARLVIVSSTGSFRSTARITQLHGSGDCRP
ncbi:MAG: ATP synthase subunit I [Planctomycetales bacterium]|nr:ATP synthase subunit I [Planctomycetales bacterium]